MSVSRPVALRTERLTKVYEVGTRAASYDTLRERLSQLRPWRRAGGAETRTYTALNDVTLEVREGEVLGIVGVNGAGKTTLLKVLSRITAPTSGRAEIFGRIGCLLEAGAGFHPELTGRENIFLSGIILGMSSKAIRTRFDEIVEFAGVQEYLDTPVKRYSSGMFVRLGFAVAVHLDPEILIVDEVLAVGDAEFQRRCFEKIQEVSHTARTVLFVSHNLAAMRAISTRAILLERGTVVAEGGVEDVLDQYQSRMAGGENGWSSVSTSNFAVDEVFVNARGGGQLKTFESAEIRVTLRALRNIGDAGFYVGILSEWNERVAGLDLRDFVTAGALSKAETIEVCFNIPELSLLPGRYRLDMHTKDMADFTIEQVPASFEFEVAQTPVYGGRHLDRWFGFAALKDANAEVRRVEPREAST